MVEIIQISDLHYGCGDFQEEWLQNAIDYVNDASPDIVICTGDITDKGRLNQYRGVKPMLDEIKPPLIVVPGNHDAKNNGMVFFEEFIGPRRTRTVLEDIDTIILGLRSPKHDIREGEIGDEQIEWIIKAFETNPLENRVMALHHHLIAVPDAGQKRDLVADAGDVLTLTQAFQVDLVLCGHKHIPHAWVIGPTTFLYCETTASRKFRHDEPPSFNHILLEGGDLEVGLVNAAEPDKDRKPLLVRKDGRTRFIRPRNFRIEQLRKSRAFDEREWSFDPKRKVSR
ncbi:MAG: metallophosphoesterase family protein [Promethearchaeota archaeon]